MRPDGDPEPDDYGLPRVDVVVPDDARELDRDIVAYHRERRQERRRARNRRLVRPFTRFGVAIPIIAGALLIALVSGALMTAFGPRPTPRPTARMLAPSASASPGRLHGLLPEGYVGLVGREAVRTRLQDLRPGVIAILPPGYRCEPMVAELAGKAQEFKLNFWLVADPRPAAGRKGMSVKDLRACAGTAHRGTAQIIEDRDGILARAYAPAPGTPGAGATAVFVQLDGIVPRAEPFARLGSGLTEMVQALETS